MLESMQAWWWGVDLLVLASEELATVNLVLWPLAAPARDLVLVLDEVGPLHQHGLLLQVVLLLE